MPKLDPNTPGVIYAGSTDGLCAMAWEYEFYVMTWNAKVRDEIEMPIGGWAIMRKGPNMVKFAKKEQCIALSKRLRFDYKATEVYIWRIYPDGEVEFLHPKDGVYPEIAKEGRPLVNFYPTMFTQHNIRKETEKREREQALLNRIGYDMEASKSIVGRINKPRDTYDQLAEAAYNQTGIPVGQEPMGSRADKVSTPQFQTWITKLFDAWWQKRTANDNLRKEEEKKFEKPGPKK